MALGYYDVASTVEVEVDDTEEEPSPEFVEVSSFNGAFRNN